MNNRQSKSGSKKSRMHKTQPKMIKSNHQITISDTDDHSKCFGDWQCRRPMIEDPQDITDHNALVEEALADIPEPPPGSMVEGAFTPINLSEEIEVHHQ